ncbi:MAG: Mur ligase domain-containing protein [Butyricimonas faecihominis]
MKELESIYNSFLAGSRITTDSREVKTGDIFIALKGENHNGNTFAEKAVAQGAKHVVIDEALTRLPNAYSFPTPCNSCNNWPTTTAGN